MSLWFSMKLILFYYFFIAIIELEYLRITGDKIPVTVIDELRCPNLRSLIVKALMPCKFDEVSLTRAYMLAVSLHLTS